MFLYRIPTQSTDRGENRQSTFSGTRPAKKNIKRPISRIFTPPNLEILAPSRQLCPIRSPRILSRLVTPPAAPPAMLSAPAKLLFRKFQVCFSRITPILSSPFGFLCSLSNILSQFSMLHLQGLSSLCGPWAQSRRALGLYFFQLCRQLQQGLLPTTAFPTSPFAPTQPTDQIATWHVTCRKKQKHEIWYHLGTSTSHAP